MLQPGAEQGRRAHRPTQNESRRVPSNLSFAARRHARAVSAPIGQANSSSVADDGDAPPELLADGSIDDESNDGGSSAPTASSDEEEEPLSDSVDENYDAEEEGDGEGEGEAEDEEDEADRYVRWTHGSPGLR